jgi:tetratricopeptide (TPR) repeat protein
VIILTNKGNSKRMEISDAILNILHDRPFTVPPGSLAEHLYAIIQKAGTQSAIATYDSLRSAKRSAYDFSEAELNSFGYQLLSERKIADAIRFFELNTIAYPTSSNAFDSLAEAYRNSGNRELAIKHYRKAIELDPSNINAVRMLEDLN